MILKNTSRVAAVVAFYVLASCGNNTKPAEQKADTTSVSTLTPASAPAGIKDLKWLAGKWQSKTPDGISFENWQMLNDSVYAGLAGFIKGTDTTVFETISLEQRGSELYYIPTVKDQNESKPIPFKLVEATADSFVFSNPQHDFPDKITYRKVSEKELVARISGKIKGAPQEGVFPMTKVD